MRPLLLVLLACGPDPLRYDTNPPAHTCHEATKAIPLAADTFLYEAQPWDAYGARPDVMYSNQLGSRCYPLARVNTADIPEGELVSAAFRFTTVNVGSKLTAFRVGGEWNEETTWFDMQRYALPWVDELGGETTTVTGRSSVDLPAWWLEEWKSGAHQNNGMMLRTEGALGFNFFASRESQDPPALVVNYIECAP